MSPDSPRSRDRDLRHAAQRIAAIGRCRRARLPRRLAERRVRRAGAPSTTRSARAGRRLGPSPPARRRPPHDRLRQPVEPHRLRNVQPPRPGGQAPTFGVTGLAARPGRPRAAPVPRPPPPAAMAAVPWQPRRPPPDGAGSVVNRCGGGWSAVADAPSAPWRNTPADKSPRPRDRRMSRLFASCHTT